DLDFVARLGDVAIAGVSAAGNAQFLVLALTQILGVGTMVLVSHAAGRKDRDDANLIFNQSLLLAAVCATATLVGGYALAGLYMRTLGADAATVASGTTYLRWFMPAMAMQFALVVLGSALRGTGIAKPTMVVQMSTVVLNALLAPVLIAGWLTGRPLGVAGAALASSISVAVGVLLLLLYFVRLEKFVAFDPTLFQVRLAQWRRILKIGLPASGEFALLFAYMAVIYWVIRGFGPEAQAGFGVGGRVMQAIFLPAMAVAFAAAPVAGQNFGARRHDRTRATFRSSIMIGSGVMFTATLLCQWQADWLVSRFTSDPAVIAVSSQFLHIVSWNFVAQGVIFTCSGLFQSLGNTVPAVISSATRIATFALPAVWLSTRPGFALRHVWYLSVATVALQMLVSLLLLRREFGRRLDQVTQGAPVAA
ncbi:MAG TPA: MATE family efflux transporter, partial [Gemmatimonadaceae bacterium]|nr:MATE family efflux transporter [Gemmatimonadaceae bacterium]